METIYPLSKEQLAIKLQAAGIEALQFSQKLGEGMMKRYHEAHANKLDTVSFALDELLDESSEDALIKSYRVLHGHVSEHVELLRTAITENDDSRVSKKGEMMAGHTLLSEIEKMGIYGS